MDRLGLGLGSGPRVVGRLWSGMRVSASFQIIPRPVGGLVLGSGLNVVGRLGSEPRVGAGGYLRVVYLVEVVSGGVQSINQSEKD